MTSVLTVYFLICFLREGHQKQKLKTGQHQTKMHLHSEGNHQQNEKAIYWMGESICNDISDKRLIFKLYKEFTQFNTTKNQIFKF